MLQLDLTEEELAAEDNELPFGADMMMMKPPTPLSIHAAEDATGAVEIPKHGATAPQRTHFLVSRKVCSVVKLYRKPGAHVLFHVHIYFCDEFFLQHYSFIRIDILSPARN